MSDLVAGSRSCCKCPERGVIPVLDPSLLIPLHTGPYVGCLMWDVISTQEHLSQLLATNYRGILVTNYRGIRLQNVAAKVLSNLFKGRLSVWAEEDSTAFDGGVDVRRCDAISVLRRLVDQ
jgi:hypothetical protein